MHIKEICFPVKHVHLKISYEQKECVCHLRNIAMRDCQESVTSGQTDARQSDPYVPLCFAGATIFFQSINPYLGE